MTYKETLFFVAQCLTIILESKNREEIEAKLKLEKIDWEAVVKVSTSHYVMPALYCNLKKVGFLNYLPKDLVAYMKYITELNRERNLQILEQAKELNELLVANDITPVFLKGTGNLLEGLYEDIAERMVGDIDFIVSKDNYCRLTVPPMVWMGFQGLSSDGSMLLNMASIVHNSLEVDRKNIEKIEFNWSD